MNIKLSEITGLMLDKGICPNPKCGRDMIFKKSSFEQYQPSEYECNGCGLTFSQMQIQCYNSAIERQGCKSVEIVFDREKLAKVIWIKITNPSEDIIKQWDEDFPFAIKYWKPGYLNIADAIIQSSGIVSIKAVKE